jgi:3-deoxy-manno-octulosonate cytidylyltransferase (CMP-KDO synthetase)
VPAFVLGVGASEFRLLRAGHAVSDPVLGSEPRSGPVIVVIPARLSARRLPGKPLMDIGGVPMVVRVARRAAQAQRVTGVVVATGDEEIIGVARAHDVAVAPTPQDFQNGTHRVAWVTSQLAQRPQVVINVQGDEPFVDPDHVDAIAEAVLRGSAIATLAAPLAEGVEDRQRVKVQWDENGDALAFSRRPLGPPHWLHLGVYGFQPATLERLVALPETAGERRERLEQLRWLDHGHKIRMVTVRRAGLSVDTPEDLARARAAVRAVS